MNNERDSCSIDVTTRLKRAPYINVFFLQKVTLLLFLLAYARDSWTIPHESSLLFIFIFFKVLRTLFLLGYVATAKVVTSSEYHSNPKLCDKENTHGPQ
jgi:hypothetical protein